MVGARFGLCGLLELVRGEVSQRQVSADAIVSDTRCGVVSHL